MIPAHPQTPFIDEEDRHYSRRRHGFGCLTLAVVAAAGMIAGVFIAWGTWIHAENRAEAAYPTPRVDVPTSYAGR